MSNNLTIGHTEFTPYNKNFDADVYLNDLNKKIKESDVDELMAEVILIYNRLGIINGVFINDMDLSKHCSNIEIDTMNHIKKLKVINANENKRGIKNEMQRKKQ